MIVEDERLADYHPELHTHAVRSVLEHLRPHVLTIPATANGRDVGPPAHCTVLPVDRMKPAESTAERIPS